MTDLRGVSSCQGTHNNTSRLIDYVFVHTDSRVAVKSVGVLGVAVMALAGQTTSLLWLISPVLTHKLNISA